MEIRGISLVVLLFLGTFALAVPQAEADIRVTWRLATTDKGEFITAYAHLYGVPKIEQEYNTYFCLVELDATKGKIPEQGIIELSVGDYAQPARKVFEMAEQRKYIYGLSPTFNNKIAEVTSPTPVTVDLKITTKKGGQLYAESKTIQMLPINYYAWVLGEKDMRYMSPVLATPHSDPIFKILTAAAKATPWNAIVGYQEVEGLSHADIVQIQMRAVYNVLQNLNVTYVHSPAAFTSTQSQRVKVPVQTISDNSGNCIETTLLFGSIFEALRFNVYYVFITGHVFVAVGEWPDSSSLFCLETTVVGTKTFDEARSIGFQTFEKAKNEDQGFYLLDVGKIREAAITPTPHMDKMPDGSEFYEDIEKVTSTITSTNDVIIKAKNALQQKTPAPVGAEEKIQEADNLYNIGKYTEAKRYAIEAIQMINKTVPPPTSTPTPPEDKTTDTIIGIVFLIIMPLAVVIFATLYVRGRKKQAVVKAAPAPTVTPPAVQQPTVRPPPTAVAARALRYCGGCGRQLALDATFCDFCGHRQRAA